jgi:hypothetical protein
MCLEPYSFTELGTAIWSFIGNNASNTIALAAAAFMAYQAKLTREHNRLSVRPHLQIHTNTERKYGEPVHNVAYTVELRNNGLGPAIITGWKVFLDGAEKALPNAKAVDDLIKELVPNYLRLTTRYFGKNEVLRANASQVILALRLPVLDAAERRQLEAQLAKLALVVEYTSMYGEELQPLDTRK